MDVLVDTSIWIDYFRSGNCSTELDALIDENLLVTNDLILAELIPYLTVKRQTKVIKLLQAINRIPIQVDWEELVDFQVTCLKSGANGMGIADLIIAQNAKSNNSMIYSLDKRFRLLEQVINIELYR